MLPPPKKKQKTIECNIGWEVPSVRVAQEDKQYLGGTTWVKVHFKKKKCLSFQSALCWHTCLSCQALFPAVSVVPHLQLFDPSDVQIGAVQRTVIDKVRTY